MTSNTLQICQICQTCCAINAENANSVLYDISIMFVFTAEIKLKIGP